MAPKDQEKGKKIYGATPNRLIAPPRKLPKEFWR